MTRLIWIALWVGCLLLMAISRCAHAQALPVTVFPSTTAGALTTYAGGTASAANAASITFANPANGALYGQASQSLALGGGRSATVAIRSAPSALAIAGAVARFGVRASGVLAVGYALYDLCKELGYSCFTGPDGNPAITKADPNICTVAPCYTHQIRTGRGDGFWIDSGVKYTAESACRAWVNSWNTTGNAAPVTYVASANGTCDVTGPSTGAFRNTYTPISTSPQTAVNLPSSFQELQDAIAAKSSWPSTSAIGRAVTDAIKNGETVPLPTPNSVTGPASAPGPSSTTTTPAQNGNPASTTTKSTTYNFTYGPNTVTNNVTNTTVVNNGTTNTTTTEQTEPEAAPSDSINPDFPTLYTRKYPNGMTGVWTTRKAELMATPLPNLIQSLAPTITAGGGCPQYSIPMNIGPWHWGTYSLGPSCDVWNFLKVCVILGAIFLARAVIFGG